MKLRSLIRKLCPPVLIEYLKGATGRHITFSGPFESWAEASANATGYDADIILDRALAAAKMVARGEAQYDRDGVTFDIPAYPFALIAVLLRAASEEGGNLKVLDYGGALGSTYFQCRHFLHALNTLRWCVVEQPHFADAGRMHFSTANLLFFKEISAVVAEYEPNVVLFSSVLQYLPDPYAVLKEVMASHPAYIVVDRNPFVNAKASILTVQRIPADIVKSSYPAWLFSESEFRAFFSAEYSELVTFEALDGTAGWGRLKADFKGMVFKRKHE